MKTSTSVLLILILALILSLPLFAQLSLHDWNTYVYNFTSSNSNYTQIPLHSNNGALTFEFPTRQTKPINYLTRGPNYNFDPVGHTMFATIAVSVISGAPVFLYDTEPSNTCIAPATVRLYFQATFASDLGYDRWWSNPIAVELAGGISARMDVPLTPDQWTDTFGARGSDSAEATENFMAALNNLDVLGLSYGGGCFFGHGIYTAGGAARFTLLDFGIN